MPKEYENLKNTKRSSVLIVEDEALIAEDIRMMLTKFGFNVVETCSSGENAVTTIDRLSDKQAAPDVVLMDITLPGKLNGIEAAIEINSRHDSAIVFLTGYNHADLYERLKGVRYFGYLHKPVRAEQACATIEYASHQKRIELKSETSRPGKDSVPSDTQTQGNVLSDMEKRLIGASVVMRDIREEIVVLAPSTIPVLILGETGTGKEIVARELYRASNRSSMSFMPLNCATIGTLADSELFGHVRGAFTGAVRSTSGYIGAANGGTLFLDELEALSLDIQAKLLRFLDMGEYSKVGDTKILHADVRIISASNKDLDSLCSQGKFRRDLYYRISGSMINTVPLRSRTEDIPALVSHFLSMFASDGEKKVPVMLPEATRSLTSYEWPGNVRQLKQAVHNLIERNRQHKSIDEKEVAKLMGASTSIIHFPSYQDAKKADLEQFNLKYFTDLLRVTQGKSKKALELSKMHRKNFYDMLRKHGLTPKDFK